MKNCDPKHGVDCKLERGVNSPGKWSGGVSHRLTLAVVAVVATTAFEGVRAETNLRGLDAADNCIAYIDRGGRSLYMHQFSPTKRPREAAAPAIAFFHGGGWRRGTPAAMSPHCRYFAERGYVCFTVEYRLCTPGSGLTVHDCVDDAREAVGWVYRNAARLRIDLDRVYAGGGSSGGHLAVTTATTSRAPDRLAASSDTPSPSALVLFNPSLVLTTHDKLPVEYNQRQSERRSDLYGGNPAPISPLSTLRSGMPPTLMLFGTEDWLLPAARLYRDTSLAIGNVCELRLWEGRRHGFYHYGKDDHRDFEETCAIAYCFLQSLEPEAAEARGLSR